MGSLFEIAKSGIQAYRQALSVTGQNIANVNTEGYSKRDVALRRNRRNSRRCYRCFRSKWFRSKSR